MPESTLLQQWMHSSESKKTTGCKQQQWAVLFCTGADLPSGKRHKILMRFLSLLNSRTANTSSFICFPCTSTTTCRSTQCMCYDGIMHLQCISRWLQVGNDRGEGAGLAGGGGGRELGVVWLIPGAPLADMEQVQGKGEGGGRGEAEYALPLHNHSSY